MIVTKTRFVKDPFGGLHVEEYEKHINEDAPRFFGHRKPEPKIYYCPHCHLALPTDMKSPCECWNCRSEDEVKQEWQLAIAEDEHQELIKRVKEEQRRLAKEDLARQEHARLARQMIKFNRYF